MTNFTDVAMLISVDCSLIVTSSHILNNSKTCDFFQTVKDWVVLPTLAMKTF